MLWEDWIALREDCARQDSGMIALSRKAMVEADS